MPTSDRECDEHQPHPLRPLQNYGRNFSRVVPAEPADSLLSTMPASRVVALERADSLLSTMPTNPGYFEMTATLLPDGQVQSVKDPPPVMVDKLPPERRWEVPRVLGVQNNSISAHGAVRSSGPQAQQDTWQVNTGSGELLLERQLEQHLEQWLEKWLDTRLKRELQALRMDLAGQASMRDAISHQALQETLQDHARVHDATAANLEARLCSLATAVEKMSTDFQKLVDVVFTELRLQAKQASEDGGSSSVATPLALKEQLSSLQTTLLGHKGAQPEHNGVCRNLSAASNMATAVVSSTSLTAPSSVASQAAGTGSGSSHSFVADSNVLSTLPESTTEEHLVHIEEQLVRLGGAINREAQLRRDFEQRWVTDVQSKLQLVGCTT